MFRTKQVWNPARKPKFRQVVCWNFGYENSELSFSGGAKNAAELAIFVSQLAIFAVT